MRGRPNGLSSRQRSHSANSILLADIVVANGAASIVTANIRDRRPYALPGALPVPTNATAAAVDAVMLQPAQGLVVQNVAIASSTGTTDQVAALVYLPRRIVGATKMRWKYIQSGATALTGNYAAAIFDSSGRLVVGFGSTAFTGATSSVQVRSETITATTFEVGWYYLFWTFSLSAGNAGFTGIDGSLVLNNFQAGAATPNIFFGADAGGFSTPNTLSALSDVYSLTSLVTLAPVPLVTLSVG